MACTHLAAKELTWIENYYEIGEKAYIVAKKLRRDGLPKGTVFNEVDEDFLKEVTFKRHIISRKTLNDYTPLEVFLAHLLDQTSGYYASHLRNMV